MTEYPSEEWGEVSFELDGLVPLDGDGHWHICLDYRGGKEPVVTYVDIECDSQKRLADSFEAFAEKLCLVPPEDNYLILGTNVQKLRKAIAKETGHKFDRASTRQYGYKRYSIVGEESKRQSIRFEENVCRRGFTPRTHHYYAELKDELDKLAVRYPEYPESAIFASASDEWHPVLMQCVEESGGELMALTEFKLRER